jgi:hypothetical protein
MRAVEWGDQGAELRRWALDRDSEEAAGVGGGDVAELESRFGAQYAAEGGVVAAAWRARTELVDGLATFDDDVADSALAALAADDAGTGERAYGLAHPGLGPADVRAALRRVTLSGGGGVGGGGSGGSGGGGGGGSSGTNAGNTGNSGGEVSDGK